MDEQQYLIELDEADTEGHRSVRFVPQDEELRERLDKAGAKSFRVTLSASDDADTEGHALSTTVTVRAALEGDDTEGHALSIHFPTREQADAFRKRLLVTGVLVGTLAAGAAGGAALSSLPGQAETGSQAVAAQAGSDWTQDERQAPAAAAAQAGSDWTQDERQAPAAAQAGSDWTQAERQAPAAAPAQAGSDWTQAERQAPAAEPAQAGSDWTQAERQAPAAAADEADEPNKGNRLGPTPR